MTLFRSRFEANAPTERWVRDFPVEEVPASIKTLYPRWDLTARPALPAPLQACDIVHATNPAAIPPARAGQKLVVTVHDLAFAYYPGMFPRSWRYLYRAGLRAAVRRADAIITPSRNTAEDLLSRTRMFDPAKLHVVPLAASLGLGDLDPDGSLARLKIRTPYIAFVGTLEPGRTSCGWCVRTGAWRRRACRTRSCWQVRSAGTTMR